MAEIGKPINRIDGLLKVTGTSKYAAEFNQKNMAYGFPVTSTIANGFITNIDTSAAQKSGGVLSVLTYKNAQKLKSVVYEDLTKVGGGLSERIVPLQNKKVEYFGQLIGIVVAETYEQARSAAAMVKVFYTKEKGAFDLKAEVPKAKRPEKTAQGEEAQINTGKSAAPLAVAENVFLGTYSTAVENHHPMEPHATIAVWEGDDNLTVYQASQGVMNNRATIAYLFDLKPENVRVLSPYIGGGFGCKASAWAQLPLAVMAAKAVGRPVKLAITRQMMQTTVGRRAPTIQTLALGADSVGKLTVIKHHTDTYSNLANYFEQCGSPTKVLYNAPVREITYAVTKLNIGAPTFMRAPGYSVGSFALESAMDEMAHKLKMDPLEFRILNNTVNDPLQQHPFSSTYLLDCYRIGAAAFGWNQRKAQPRQTKEGKQLIGYGMATATYHALRTTAAVRIRMTVDGKVVVMCAAQDIGTGTYTIMAQTAADGLGVPIENITVEIGDSSLPPGPMAAGSNTTATVLPAVMSAAEQLRKDLLQLTMADSGSDLKGATPETVGFGEGKFYLKNNLSKSISYQNILKRSNKEMIEACVSTKPLQDGHLGPKAPPCMPTATPAEINTDGEKYSFHSFGAQFAEVSVDEDLGTIRIKRITSVQDVGSIMNEKTARSQVIGGIIYHIGQALMEETVFDERWGNPATRSFADYHVPVQLDIPQIDVHFIGKPDPHISSMGARGVGEIAGVGIAAAIANAVFNATGKRLRDLPFTLDKLIE